MSLFSEAGLLMILRWLHFFFGIMWIGHLYYFNFTQMPVAGKADATMKSGINRFILPEAMWWFRWGAMWTMVTGVIYLMMFAHRFSQGGVNFFTTGYGVAISTGAVLGLTMWANVWFVIWPRQKIVIANAEQVAGGGAAIPGAAEAAAQARLASRTNTMFSVPMLFYMGAASHFAPSVSDDSKHLLYWLAFAVVWGALQLNALKGKIGPLDTVKGVIASGFGLTAVIFVLIQILVG